MIKHGYVGYDFDDLSIVPPTFTKPDSRKELDILNSDKMLPLFAAPMDTVIDEKNAELFLYKGINVCLPRGLTVNNDSIFHSYGLNEIIDLMDNNPSLIPKRVLIDVANGHMQKLLRSAERFKNSFPDKELMIGNIANPSTYAHISNNNAADYVRVGIGGGAGCLTAVHTGVFYPMASLISECNDIRMKLNSNVKIVADGGFKTYRDICMALSLGADYVMIGSLFNKALESCAPIIDINKNIINSDKALKLFNSNVELYKNYRGMSTKDVQRKWNKDEIKTAEGISFYNKVEYTLDGWIDNFTHYLRSSMSYCSVYDLEHYKSVMHIPITQNAFKRFNK